MRRYQKEINEGGNYKKYLKHLITVRIPNAQFVKSLRKNEPENIVLQSTLSKAVDLWSTLHDTDEKVTYLKHISRLLREEFVHGLLMEVLKTFRIRHYYSSFCGNFYLGVMLSKCPKLATKKYIKLLIWHVSFLLKTLEVTGRYKFNHKMKADFYKLYKLPCLLACH